MGELWVNHVSYSQLSSSEECPYAYFLEKMMGIKTVENGFAQAGTLAHQLLAAWAKGVLTIEELPNQWMQQFARTVTAEFPRYLPDYAEKTFAAVLKYFQNFDGFPGYEIVGAEQEFVSSIAGERFEGVIDLILRDVKTGELTIIDHKSCSLPTFRKSKEKMYRQLWLYSKYCADHFGVFPQTLAFNLFREGVIDRRQFDPESYMATRIWAESVITEMKGRDFGDWFETKPDYFRCTNLCGCRNACPCGQPEYHKRKEEKNGRKKTPAVARSAAANS